MKAFVASVVALIAIAAVAGFALQNVDRSSQTVYTSPAGSVRL